MRDAYFRPDRSRLLGHSIDLGWDTKRFQRRRKLGPDDRLASLASHMVKAIERTGMPLVPIAMWTRWRGPYPGKKLFITLRHSPAEPIPRAIHDSESNISFNPHRKRFQRGKVLRIRPCPFREVSRISVLLASARIPIDTNVPA